MHNFYCGLLLFADHIRILQNVTRIEYTSLAMGNLIKRNPDNRYVVQEAVLQRAWELLRNNSLDIRRFLACANHFLRAFGNHMLITTVLEVDYFFNAQNHNISYCWFTVTKFKLLNSFNKQYNVLLFDQMARKLSTLSYRRI